MERGKINLVFLLLILGIGILFWPAICSLVHRHRETGAIQAMQKQLEVTDIEKQRSLAEEYNAGLLAAGGASQEEYNQILDIDGGMMGYLEIPKLGVELPIYHGTGEVVLAKGVGHLTGSAFPIGGEGNHSVLAGHTGLPGAELFTNLTELAEGDTFCISVLGQLLIYEVDQVKTVLPGEGEDLTPVPGEDHCTLVTCTPYGINSHRLLVRGKRVETGPETAPRQEPVRQGHSPLNWLLPLALGLPLLIAGVLLAVIKRRG